MMSDDILHDLRKCYDNPLRAGIADSDVNAVTSKTGYAITADVLGRAINEIIKLSERVALAGAVTQGSSFSELAKDLPRRSREDNSRDRKNG